FVLSSGRAEGDDKKPFPALEVVAIDTMGNATGVVGRVMLDPSDDPERLTLSVSDRYAAISLAKSKQTVAVDLTTRESPRLVGRPGLVTADSRYVSSSSDSDWIMMPVASEGDTVAIELPRASSMSPEEGARGPARRADYLISAHQNESALEILQAMPRRTV